MAGETIRSRLEDALGEMVVIRWIDSAEPSDNADVESHELPRPQDIEQYGILLRAAPDHIVVAGAVKTEAGGSDENATYDYVIAIPTVAVLQWSLLSPTGGG